METKHLKGHIDSDGILRLEVPIGIPDQDIEVIVVFQRPRLTQEAWHAFIEQTAGSLPDDPIILA
ncbi:MAG: hypothetical protein H7Y11_00800 [Armatimonadetes bacterium]|nr:hypothetical protein [Anaerolineae bacterium]